jgi:hypothetical protein
VVNPDFAKAKNIYCSLFVVSYSRVKKIVFVNCVYLCCMLFVIHLFLLCFFCYLLFCVFFFFWFIFSLLTKQIQSNPTLHELFGLTEMPITSLVSEMEHFGIGVDVEILEGVCFCLFFFPFFCACFFFFFCFLFVCLCCCWFD